MIGRNVKGINVTLLFQSKLFTELCIRVKISLAKSGIAIDTFLRIIVFSEKSSVTTQLSTASASVDVRDVTNARESKSDFTTSLAVVVENRVYIISLVIINKGFIVL